MLVALFKECNITNNICSKTREVLATEKGPRSYRRFLKFPHGTTILGRAQAVIQEHRVLVVIVVSTASIRTLLTISFHLAIIQANSIGEVKTENLCTNILHDT